MSDANDRSMWTSYHAALIGGERWDEFDRVYRPLIRTWAGRWGLQDADTDDLAQDVFARLTTTLPTYDPQRGAFRGWLHTAVRHTALNHLRHRARHPAGFAGGGDNARERLEQEAADQLATDLSGVADARRERLARVQAACSPRDWEVTVAYRTGGGTASDVGRAFGMSAGAVHQAVYRVTRAAEALLGVSA